MESKMIKLVENAYVFGLKKNEDTVLIRLALEDMYIESGLTADDIVERILKINVQIKMQGKKRVDLPPIDIK